MAIIDLFPRLGLAGSRSAHLHEGTESQPLVPLSPRRAFLFRTAVLSGIFGSIFIAVGGIGAGALPVVGNSLWSYSWFVVLGHMLHTSTIIVLVGVCFLVTGWILLMNFALPRHSSQGYALVPTRSLKRTFFLWILPLIFTAPLFTQDIYSYLAQGSITRMGLDPYHAGPIDILGINHPLARNVPSLWSHSPSPYGPVALGIGAAISWITQDHIYIAIIAHRLINVLSLILAGWALEKLSRRCGVQPQSAIWLAILNPLTIIHLVAGIHNEAILLGLLLAGLELCFQATDKNKPLPLYSLGVLIITAAGLVKVTALMALGFAAIALSQSWNRKRENPSWRLLCLAGLVTAMLSVFYIVALSLLSGAGFGWITSQGGATEVLSWMSISTAIGLGAGSLGMFLGLGDHIHTTVQLGRLVGIIIALFWIIRMLWASFQERIHPLGGLGVATLMMVTFFPVVQPWYLLWAVFPLAAWANIPIFRKAVIIYSVIFSFSTLPKGLTLPAGTVIWIWLLTLLTFILLLLLARWRYMRVAVAYNPSSTLE